MMEPLVDAMDVLMIDEGTSFASYDHKMWFEIDPRERFEELCKSRKISKRDIRVILIE